MPIRKIETRNITSMATDGSNQSSCDRLSSSDTEENSDDEVCIVGTVPAKPSSTPRSAKKQQAQQAQQSLKTPRDSNKKSPFGMGKITLSSSHKKGLSLTPDSKKMSPKTPALNRVSQERVPDGIIGMKVRTPPSISKDRRPSSQS